MHHDYDYLIVGGGMTADAAANGIREQRGSGSIGILGEEPTAPFPRPALSKKLWTDPDFTVDSAALATEQETGATLHLGTRVTGVDVAAKQVSADSGDTFGYGQLLIATGGHPRHLPGLEPSDRVLYYRSLTDYQRLRALSGGGLEIAVVGDGFVGTEIAAALADEDCAVSLVFGHEVLGAGVFPEPLARRFQALYEDAGVRIVAGAQVTGGEQHGDRVTLTLDNGASLDVDAVVVGLGIEPATAFLDGVLDRADDGGIVVDDRLTTSVSDVFAAGDVARYPDRILGSVRVEHVDNADTMGAAVGRIMAGSSETYDHTPMFYSDILEHGYEAVGTLDASLETVVDDLEDDATVVYYLDDHEVRGVLIWDGEGGIDDAKKLLAAHSRPANPTDLVGTIR